MPIYSHHMIRAHAHKGRLLLKCLYTQQHTCVLLYKLESQEFFSEPVEVILAAPAGDEIRKHTLTPLGHKCCFMARELGLK